MSEKLQEARFFADAFDRSHRRKSQEARAATYYLHAFLAAACSVILIAEHDLTIWGDERKPKRYRAPFRRWYDPWRDADAAKSVLKFLSDQRNSSAHEGAVDEITVEWVPVPVSQFYIERLATGPDSYWTVAANMMHSADPEATIAEPKGMITVDGKAMAVTAFCSSCVDALGRLIVDFNHANPKRESSVSEHHGYQLTARAWALDSGGWNADVLLTNVARANSRFLGIERTFNSESAAASAASDRGVAAIEGTEETFQGRNVLP